MRKTADYRAQIRGRCNREVGAYWEKMIDRACEQYKRDEKAAIEKTPEPMKVLSKPNNKGQFLACFAKAAQPDYKGTLAGGRAVVFEAKHTDTGKMSRNAISVNQEIQLNLHQKLGATTFVLLSFGLTQFFRVPWDVFRDMKTIYGRKYMTPDDIRAYQIKYEGGYLHFL